MSFCRRVPYYVALAGALSMVRMLPGPAGWIALGCLVGLLILADEIIIRRIARRTREARLLARLVISACDCDDTASPARARGPMRAWPPSAPGSSD